LRLASLSCLTYFKGFVAATLRLDSSHYNAIAGNDLEAPIEHLSGWLQEAAKLNRRLPAMPKA
ncbi:MAG: hypothetical protein SFU83_20725, partial [Meiothermus sp.]|nr:hypothetical protein [Meiothermus sp.]